MSEVDTRPAVSAKAGDFVKLRSGVIVGPLRDEGSACCWPLRTDNMSWTRNGRVDVDNPLDDCDIVAIVPRPTPALQQPVERSGGLQMRVGGRYRLRNGEVATCVNLYQHASDGEDLYRVEWRGGAYAANVLVDGRANRDRELQTDVIAEVTDDATSEPQRVEPPSQPSRYHRQFCGVTIDLYRVANLWGVRSHALFHAMKKIMMAGQRGAKDYETDLREAIVAIEEELKIAKEGGAS